MSCEGVSRSPKHLREITPGSPLFELINSKDLSKEIRNLKEISRNFKKMPIKAWTECPFLDFYRILCALPPKRQSIILFYFMQLFSNSQNEKDRNKALEFLFFWNTRGEEAPAMLPCKTQIAVGIIQTVDDILETNRIKWEFDVKRDRLKVAFLFFLFFRTLHALTFFLFL